MVAEKSQQHEFAFFNSRRLDYCGNGLCLIIQLRLVILSFDFLQADHGRF